MGSLLAYLKIFPVIFLIIFQLFYNDFQLNILNCVYDFNIFDNKNRKNKIQDNLYINIKDQLNYLSKRIYYVCKKRKKIINENKNMVEICNLANKT